MTAKRSTNMSHVFAAPYGGDLQRVTATEVRACREKFERYACDRSIAGANHVANKFVKGLVTTFTREP